MKFNSQSLIWWILLHRKFKILILSNISNQHSAPTMLCKREIGKKDPFWSWKSRSAKTDEFIRRSNGGEARVDGVAAAPGGHPTDVGEDRDQSRQDERSLLQALWHDAGRSQWSVVSPLVSGLTQTGIKIPASGIWHWVFGRRINSNENSQKTSTYYNSSHFHHFFMTMWPTPFYGIPAT